MFVLGPGNDSEMEVVLVTNDENHECQVQLLQSILDRQRAALGPKDIIVARTLNQLGEVMSNRKNWQESEEYFREAFEILKDAADENPRLHEIRLKLAKTLKNKGDIASAVEELKDCKDTIEKMDLEKELTGLLKKVKSEINKGGKRK